MTKLVWGEPDKRLHEIGVDRGVFYPRDGIGVPWNGLVAVSEAPSDGDSAHIYQEGNKIHSRRGGESFAAKVSAFTYPPEMERYLNAGPYREVPPFDFAYRTLLGNGLNPQAGYKIHLVYNVTMTPTSMTYGTLSNTVDAEAFAWDLFTVPEFLPQDGYSAHLVIDPSVAHPWVIEKFEDILYGNSFADPRMPNPFEVVEIFEDGSILKITDHGDGTWTAEGPDEAIKMLSSTMFEITWPSALYIDNKTYRISSL